MNLPVIIRIYKNNQLVMTKQFSQDQIIIGNHPDVHIELKDPNIAHFHTSIEKKKDQFFLMDLGSEGGTFIENRKIIEEKIQSGTSFQIGEYKIEFFIGAPKMASQFQNETQKSVNEPALEESSTKEPAIKKLTTKEPAIKKLTTKEPTVKKLTTKEPTIKEPDIKESSYESLKPKPLENNESQKEKEPSTDLDHQIKKDNFPSLDEGPDSKANPPFDPSSSNNVNINSLKPPSVIEDKTYYTTITQTQKKTLSSEKLEPEWIRNEKIKENNINPEVKEDLSFQIYPVQDSSQTFAPSDAFKDLKEVIKPGKGSSIEVLVTWKKRILNTYHFNKKSQITIGSSPSSDIKIPLLNVSKHQHKLIRFNNTTTVYFTKEMTGSYTKKNQEEVSFYELINTKKVKKTFSGYKITIHQEEMAKIDFQGGLISVYIRYSTKAPKPPLGSFLDLNSMEMTGFFLAIVLSILLSFYMSVYTENQEKNKKPEEPIRKVFIQMVKKKKPPTPKKIQVMKKKSPLPKKDKLEIPKKIVSQPIQKKMTQRKKIVKPKPKLMPKPSPKIKKKKLIAKKKPAFKPRPSSITRRNKKRKKLKIASNVKTKKFTKTKKTSTTKNKLKDPTKVGLLSILGSKGTQSKLSKIYSGSGDINKNVKSRDKRTVLSGLSTDTLSDTFNRNSTGRTGKSMKTVSIGKVKGKISRNKNYGYGYGKTGLKKSKTQFVNFDGRGAKFSESMDKEAIRRVIRRNEGAIKSCYTIALNKRPSLHGRIVLSWYIELNGSVSRARVVSNTVRDSKMAKCILTHLRSWSFPPPPGKEAAKVRSYPIVFSPLK